MKVAVIGAGPCGLPTIKCCLEEGLDVVCYECRDTVGGLWNYSDGPVEEGLGTVMRNTVTNLNKETMSYSDYLVPRDFPQYLPHAKLLEYYQMYANHFRLNKHIRFNTRVTRICQASRIDQRNLGQWEVTTKNLRDGETQTETYDAVLVCTGHHGIKNTPQFNGQETFSGQILHSHDYRNREDFVNKRVLIIGTGNSAFDIAADLNGISSQVYVSSRRGAWIISRIGDFGLPADITFNSRWLYAINRTAPMQFLSKRIRAMLNARFDHAFYGLEPDYDIRFEVPTTNDLTPSLIASGAVRIKPLVKKITETSVTFIDGSTVDNVDAIICATGYSLGLPFIDHDAFKSVQRSTLPLYKSMFVPDIQPPTLAVIGIEDTSLANCIVAEMQARYVASVLKGAINLPDATDMRQAVDKFRLLRRKLGYTDDSGLQHDPIGYMDSLAEEIGCSPPGFVRLLLTDRPLLRAMYTGVFTSHQYRIRGPGAWPTARQAVIDAMDRLQFPVLVKPTARKLHAQEFSEKSRKGWKLLITAVICGVVAYLYFLTH